MPTATVIRQLKSGPGSKEISEQEVKIPWSYYDIVNPLPARRVLYDGIENTEQIVLEPGEKKVGVRLADQTFEELRRRNKDLKIAKGKQPDEPDKPKGLGE
jgi:hypothetical protein